MKRFTKYSSIVLMVFVLALVAAGTAVAFDEFNPTPNSVPLLGPTWGKVTVTAKVEAGRGVSTAAIQKTRDGISAWNAAMVHRGYGFTLADVTGTSVKPDISIRVKLGGGMVQGQALCKVSGDFFTNCKLNVSGKAFGSANSDNTVLSIALQEIGHALGLGHATNTSDVMFGTLQSPPNTDITKCDMDAFAEVMHWLINGETSAHAPHVSSVSCP